MILQGKLVLFEYLVMLLLLLSFILHTLYLFQWSVYIRHIIRKAKGLVLLIELLNHAHDTVVRSSATALRNIAVDHTNKLMIGE